MLMKNKKQNLKSAIGFTLIEAVIYLAIAGTSLYFISSFAFNSMFGKAKIDTVHDVNDNGKALVDQIAKDVQSAVGVNQVYNSPN